MITNAEIGKRIKALREELNVTQTELGRALGYTSHVPVSKMERDEQIIGIVDIDKIARALGVSLQYLIPDLRIDQQSSALSVALRASPFLTTKEQSEILQYYKLKREQKQRQREMSRESILGGFKPGTPEGVRALARYHLRELNATKPPIDLKYARFHWDIEYEEKDWGKRISGFLLRDGLLRLICVNISHTLFRKRMTIAHEMGHFHLDTTEFHCNKVSRERDDSREELAFQYANELLMPSDWFQANKERWQRDPKGIAYECQVSPIACEMWARELGLSLPTESELMNKHEDILDKWERKRVREKAS